MTLAPFRPWWETIEFAPGEGLTDAYKQIIKESMTVERRVQAEAEGAKDRVWVNGESRIITIKIRKRA